MGNNKGKQVRFDEHVGRKILDRLAENPDVTAVARLIDCGTKTIWFWCHASVQEKAAFDGGMLQRKPKFLIRWPAEAEDAETWLHEGVRLALKMFSLTADFLNRSEIAFGHKKALHDPKTGRVLYELDEQAIDLVGHPDPFSKEAKETADMLGIKGFPYLLDERGRRIKCYERTPVAAQLKIHSLRSIAPSTYDIADRTEHSGTLQSHVLIVGGNKVDRTPSPLRNDLEQRLQAIRARGPENPRPENPAALAYQRGAGANDPPEKLTVDGNPAADVPAEPKPPADLTKHPRAYTVPKPAYARPDAPQRAEPLDRSGHGYGVVPAGGFKVT